MVGADRFRQKKGNDSGNTHHYGRHPHMTPVHARKAALGPVMQIDNVGIRSKCYGKVRNSRTYIANHNTGYQQRRHTWDLS